MSNLAIASDLHLSPAEIEKTAKESLANLLITALEYGKFSKETKIHQIATCVNPEEAEAIRQKGKGIIFFCAHQANWEVLFLEGTSRMKGIAIGQPIANSLLYQWVLRMRQKFGGTIVEPKQAVKEGLKALKKGIFLGIVGDQGMPGSGFCCPFLGRDAWTSPLPAILSHRSDSPIIFATTVRKNGKYFIHYSKPLWPDLSKPAEEDTSSLMKQALSLLEESIRENPGQWLWQHNKWKQQGPGKLKKKYRQDTLAVFFPEDPLPFEEALEALRTIYPTEWISFFTPSSSNLEPLASEVIHWTPFSDPLPQDYRFKLVLNFSSDSRIETHFLRLAAFEALNLKNIAKLSSIPEAPLSKQIEKVFLNAC